MTLAKQKRPVRGAGRAVGAKASNLVHMNQEIADAANNEDGRNGPKNQYGHFLLQLLSVGRGPVAPRMIAYCSVQTFVVLTADSASTLVL